MHAVFLGSGDFARDLLSGLLRSGFTPLGVVTRPDRPAGRGRRARPTPVKALAREEGLRIYEPEGARDPALLSALDEMRPELLLVADYGCILTREILDYPPRGCVNVHPSLLPRYRGAAPIRRALMDGVRTTGVSLMLMDEGVDTGDIIAQEEVEVRGDDDALSLRLRLAALGARLVVEALPLYLAGSLSPKPQDEEKATYARPLGKEELAVDWTRPAIAIHNQVRALSPRPGAHTYFRARRVKILRSKPREKVVGLTPGALVAEGKEVLLAGTGKGALQLELLQPQGGRVLSAGEFLRGYRLAAAEGFEAAPSP